MNEQLTRQFREYLNRKNAAFARASACMTPEEKATVQMFLAAMEFFVSQRNLPRFLYEKRKLTQYVAQMPYRLIVGKRMVVKGDAYLFEHPATLQHTIGVLLPCIENPYLRNFAIHGMNGEFIGIAEGQFLRQLKKGMFLGNAVKESVVSDMFNMSFKETP